MFVQDFTKKTAYYKNNCNYKASNVEFEEIQEWENQH